MCTNRRIVSFAVAILFVFFFLITNSTATEFNGAKGDDLWDSTGYSNPPEDYDTYRDEPLSESQHWEILHSRSTPYSFEGDQFCVGIFRYKSLANCTTLGSSACVQGLSQDPSEGWMYGYYSTPVTGINGCDEIDGIDRPALLFLHGFGHRGTYQWASRFARIVSSSADPAIVFSISAPGQGYDCKGNKADADAPECEIYDEYQISHGDPMGSYNELFEGFTGFDAQPINPDRSMLWGYVMSAMRAVSVLQSDDMVNDVLHGGLLGWTNEHVVVGGFSGGGVAALIQAGIDDRLDGVFALSALGAFEENVKVPGSWSLMTWAGNLGQKISRNGSVDCNNLSTAPDYARRGCQMVSWMDPTLFEPNSDIMLSLGAQDGGFSYKPLIATLEAYDNFGTDVYLHYQADFDHLYIFGTWLRVFEYLTRKKMNLPPYSGDRVEGFLNVDWLNTLNTNYGINRTFVSLGGFTQAKWGNATGNLVKLKGDVEITDGVDGNNNYYWHFCVTPYYLVGQTPNYNVPEDIYFNITLDEFYHVLPACSSGAWDDNNHEYRIDLNSANGYNFNSDCRDSQNNYCHYEKCQGGTWGNFYNQNMNLMPSGSTTAFYAEATSNSPDPGYEHCVHLVIENVSQTSDLPEHIVAWPEYRYNLALSGGASKEMVSTIDVDDTTGKFATWYRDNPHYQLQPCTKFNPIGANKYLYSLPVIDTKEFFRYPTPSIDCVDLEIDENLEFEDGAVVYFEDTNIIIKDGGSLSVSNGGSLYILSDGTVEIEDGGYISAANTSGGGGYIGIYAKNISVANDTEDQIDEISANGTDNGGTISLYSLEDTTISGDLTANGTAAGSDGGEISITGSGNFDHYGLIDAQGGANGGTIHTSFDFNTILRTDSMTRAKSNDFWGYGGEVTIESGLELKIEGDADLRAGATLWTRNGTIDLVYCQEDILQDASFYPDNPGETTSCPFDLKEGSITSNTTWTAAGGPYLITDDIYICGNPYLPPGNGATLTIEPGAEIYFMDGKFLWVGDYYGGCGESTLDADGSGGVPILFSSAAASPQPGDWGAIVIQDDSQNNVISNCIFEYGGASGTSAMVNVLDETTTVEDSIFAWSGSSGLRIQDSLVDVTSCWIHDNTETGFIANNVPTNSLISDSLIVGNDIGIEVVNDSDLEVSTCEIDENFATGIYVQYSYLTMEDSDAIANGFYGYETGGYYYSSGVFVDDLYSATVTVSDNNAIYGNMPSNPDVDYEYELINASSYQVDATYNWWNTTVSQEINDRTLGNVDYSNYLTSAP